MLINREDQRALNNQHNAESIKILFKSMALILVGGLGGAVIGTETDQNTPATLALTVSGALTGLIVGLVAAHKEQISHTVRMLLRVHEAGEEEMNVNDNENVVINTNNVPQYGTGTA